jgi:Uma2 family endonuclease
MVLTPSKPVTLAEFLLMHGTQLGWLIDPDEQVVFVYYPEQETEVFDETEAILPMPLFMNELKLTIKELFAWLLE